MFEVLLTIHIIACVAMIVTILLQRSEGGGLGLGTGGGVGGLMTGRGAANALTRTTVIFATIFISTSITLALMAKANRGTPSIIPRSGGGLTLPEGPAPSSPTTPLPSTPAPASPSGEPSAIPVPAAPAPATPAPAAPAGSQPAPQPASPPPSGGGN
jgi:preprotein translocase subunit SecG